MLKPALLISAAALLTLAACGKPADSINVNDANNSAGAALENSAAELDATTDNLVENEVANINAEANAAGAGDQTSNSAAK